MTADAPPRPDFPTRFPQGRLLAGRFRIVNYLAEGGFGAVFRADQEVLNQGIKLRQVALKITVKTDLNPFEAKEILVDAILVAEVMSEIQDYDAKRYLVPIYDVGVLGDEYDRRGFIAMEFIHGKPLADSLARRMPQATCLRYTREMCTGLAALHTLPTPVIHRDLKPDNILLTKAKDEVRIVDFGLAARIERKFGYVPGTAGTKGYMSPETSIRAESSCASDVYSIGVMMYEMLTGIHPFEHLMPPPGLSEAQQRLWINNEKRHNRPDPPSRHNNTIQPELDAIVLKCLRYHDYERYANAAELLAALEAVDAPEDEASPPGPTPQALLDQGKGYARQQKWAAARKAFEQGLQCDPQDDALRFALHHQLALALIHLRNRQAAEQQIETALNLDKQKVILTSKIQRAAFYRTAAEAFEAAGIPLPARKYRNLEAKEMDQQ